MKIPRKLQPEEIETRPQTIKQNGCSLLLYKDARADMKILDETFGIAGWKREHQIIGQNLYCTVSIWDEQTKQWIPKQDVGTESNSDAEKGHASDSFKRACVNIGIGRELYTSPFIWINLSPSEVSEYKGKFKLNFKTKFFVKKIEYDNDIIIKLQIVDDNGNIRYNLGYDGKVANNIGESTISKPAYTAPTATEKTVPNPTQTVKPAEVNVEAEKIGEQIKQQIKDNPKEAEQIKVKLKELCKGKKFKTLTTKQAQTIREELNDYLQQLKLEEPF